MDKKILLITFRNTALAVLYIFIVSQLMQNGDNWFYDSNEAIAAFSILLLFCLSAALVGGLVFGQSVLYFINNKKTESIKAAVYSVAWLGVYTLIGLLILALT